VCAVLLTYAMALARSTPAYLPARLRIPSYAVWETAVLVLNVLAFFVIGAGARADNSSCSTGRAGLLGLAGRSRTRHGNWSATALDPRLGAVGPMADKARRGDRPR
jgi:hypothetical protein